MLNSGACLVDLVLPFVRLDHQSDNVAKPLLVAKRVCGRVNKTATDPIHKDFVFKRVVLF